MSKRPEITKNLSMALERYLNPQNDTRIYIAKEVTFDYGTNHATRVDYMRFKPVNNTVSGIEKGDFYCYEIKSSVEDFHSGHGLNFIDNWTACELINNGKTAVIQSHGVTSGAWPGYTMPQFGNGDYYADSIDGHDISGYNNKMKELYDAIKDVEDKSAPYGKGLYLVSKEN